MRARLAFATFTVALAAGCGEMPAAALLDDIYAEEEGEDRHLRLLPIAGDVNWLTYVASYDVSELKLARLAQQHSNAQLVQQFAAVKRARHQRSFDQAVVLASHANRSLPVQVSAVGERHFQRLNHIGAALFDREFLALQVQLHQEAAKAADRAAAQAPAGEVRAWAARVSSRWRRDEVWAGQLYSQVLTGRRGALRPAEAVP